MAAISLSNAYGVAIAASNQAYTAAAGGGAGAGTTTTLAPWRNKIINGDMRIDQRNAGAPIAITYDDIYYGPDRMYAYVNTYSSLPIGYTFQQRALSNSEYSTTGVQYAARLTTTSNLTAFPSSYSFVGMQYVLEGYNIADLQWGTSNATSNVTFSMWMRTNVTGTHSVAFTNCNCDRSFVAPFNMAAADTWSNVVVRIPAPPFGSVFDTGSNLGLRIHIDTTCAGYSTDTSNAWVNAFDTCHSNYNPNIWLTSGNYVEVTALQLESGSNATAFESRPLATELELCQRYYEKNFPFNVAPAANASAVAPGDTMYFANQYGMGQVNFKQPKVAAPIVNFYNPSSTTGNVRNSAGADYTVTPLRATTNGVALAATSAGINSSLGYFNWSADADYKKYDANPGAGTVQWLAKVANGTTNCNIYSVCATSDGGIAVTGVYDSSALFTAYNATGTAFGTTLGSTSTGVDVFVAKYSSAGAVQWLARLGSTSFDSGNGICSTSDGGIAVTGYYSSTSTFTAYNATGTAFSTTLVATSTGNDVFVAKYSSAGVVQWLARLANSGTDSGQAICSTNDGGIAVTGNYNSTTLVAYNANGTAFGTNITNSNGGQIIFITKYSSSGAVQWLAKLAGSTGGDTGKAICLTSDGGIAVSGAYGSTFTAYNANGTAFGTTLVATSTGVDVFVAKYSSAGAVQWIARVGGSSSSNLCYGISSTSDGGIALICIDDTMFSFQTYHANGNVFTGSSRTLYYNYGCFVVKYSVTGIVQWVAGIKIANISGNYGICTTTDGAIVAAGTYYSDNVIAYDANGRPFGQSYDPLPDNLYKCFIVKYSNVADPVTAPLVRNRWVAQAAAGTATNYLYGVAVSAVNNSITAVGLYNSTTLTTYDASGTAFATTLAQAGNGDACVINYSSAGAVNWVARIAGTADERAQAVCCLTDGGFVVTGYYNSTGALTAYNATGTAFGTTLAASSTDQDVYIVKYTSAGAVAWIARAASTSAASTDAAKSICATPDGGFVLVGSCNNNSTFTLYNADGTAFGTTLPGSSTAYDAFVAKYNTSGAAQWLARIASASTEDALAVCALSDGTVVVGGTYGGTLTAYNAAGTAFTTTLAYGTSQEAFVVAYTSAGAVSWVSRITSADTDFVNGLCATTDGGVVAVGYFSSGTLTAYNATTTAFGTTLTTLGVSDTFIVKYTAAGAVSWIARIGGTSDEMANAVCAVPDANGGIVVTGQFMSNPLTAYDASGIAFGTTLINTGSYDVFMVRYDNNGYVQTVAGFTGSGVDMSYAIATHPDGDVVVAGSTTSSNFTPYSALRSITATSGTADGWVAKYGVKGVAAPVDNGRCQWVARLTGTVNEAGNGICSTSDGGIVVTGYYNSSYTFTAYNATGTAFGTTLAVTSTSDEVFVAKYSSNGMVQWLARLGSTSFDSGNGICSTSDGGIAVTGYYSSTSTFTAYNANGTAFSTTLPSTSTGNDTFVAKYSSAGAVQWLARLGGSGGDYGFGICSTSDGGIVASGTYESSSTFTAYNATGTAFGTTLPTTSTNIDTFVAKYSSAGAVQWLARLGGGSGVDYVNSICSTSDGGIAVTGYYDSSYTFTAYNATGTSFSTTLPATSTSNNGFIAKYSSAGAVQWVARLSCTSDDGGQGICSMSDGGIAMMGYYVTSSSAFTAYNANGTAFSTTLLATSTNYDVFIVKYSSAGAVQWLTRLGGANNDVVQGNCICSTSDGGIAVTGYYDSSVAFTAYNATGTAFGTTLVATSTSQDVFVAKYTSSGMVSCLIRLGLSGNDVGISIIAGPDRSVYVTGYYTGTLTAYHANGAAFGTTLAPTGNQDAFIAKYIL